MSSILRKFRQDARIIFFILKVLKDQKRLPVEAVRSPFPQIFKNGLGKSLNRL